jgi:hypothetical protein
MSSRRTLRLQFTSGGWLEFTSDSGYESFQLVIEGDEFVV